MQINLGDFAVSFENGGLRVIRDGKTLYFNARPVYVSVKTYAAVNEFRDAAYDRICEQDGAVTGETLFVTRNGSEISVRDISLRCLYRELDDIVRIRNIMVLLVVVLDTL